MVLRPSCQRCASWDTVSHTGSTAWSSDGGRGVSCRASPDESCRISLGSDAARLRLLNRACCMSAHAPEDFSIDHELTLVGWPCAFFRRVSRKVPSGEGA